MKYNLPSCHGLSDKSIKNLVYTEGESYALTDAQYAALDIGVASGTSILVVSPTSTGKTQIAVWGIAGGIERNLRVVYLVTLRALAKQKFDDFKNILSESHLDNDMSRIVLATGDMVIDGRGENPSDPLGANLLIATYEKYLAMLSASGVPSSSPNTVLICDEIQLIGDKSRGQNVEILLTLMKNIGWNQFIGLSAVLGEKDSKDLANWLGVELVRELRREKDLAYEYWSSSGVQIVKTSNPELVQKGSSPVSVAPSPLAVIRHLEEKDSTIFPIIVFCMKKQDIYDLAYADLEFRKRKVGPQIPLDFGDIPDTTATSFLADALAHRIGIHSADLTDEERGIVEQSVLSKQVDVVYATTTLAAGVNFPLGAAIFSSWQRYDFGERRPVPIDPAEFHNMAGRVGRMGFEHAEGRVIFFASHGTFANYYSNYLDLGELPPISSRMQVKSFDQLGLQLISSGLVQNRESLIKLICSSLSGLREQDYNKVAFDEWPSLINTAVNELLADKLIVEMQSGQLLATPVGKSTAHSGFKPKTSVILVQYFVSKAEKLASLLDNPANAESIDRFCFLVFAAAFACPEFQPYKDLQPSRYLPWPIRENLYDASIYASDLLEPQWFVAPSPVNAAKLSLDWINGHKLIELERFHGNLSAGMLLEMYRNLGWMLQGMASILSAASDPRTPDPIKHSALINNPNLIKNLAKIPRSLTRLSFRVSAGLPDDVLWMNNLNRVGEPFRLHRDEIIALRAFGLSKPERLMLGGDDENSIRVNVFGRTKPSPQAKANWVRDRSRSWKSEQRVRCAERQREKALGCSHLNLIDSYYAGRGEKFELALEAAFSYVKIKYVKIDDRKRLAAPDYLISLDDSPGLIMEVKSKEGAALVNLNQSVEVLAASELHGFKDLFCVTLCHPGVDPSVPPSIMESGRLSVVESGDLGEALLRLCQNRITQQQLWHWLATPGQALIEDLPFTIRE